MPFNAYVISSRSEVQWRAFEKLLPEYRVAYCEFWFPPVANDALPDDHVPFGEEILILGKLRFRDGRILPVYAPKHISAEAACLLIDKFEGRNSQKHRFTEVLQ